MRNNSAFRLQFIDLVRPHEEHEGHEEEKKKKGEENKEEKMQNEKVTVFILRFLKSFSSSLFFLFLRALRVLRGVLKGFTPLRRRYAVTILLLALFAGGAAFSQDRFPRPEFKSDYTQPTLQVPNAPDSVYEYIDLGLLAAAIIAVSAVALKLRSRNVIFLISIASVAYFGFVRRGCICPVGSIQNVTLALADPTYAVPLSVVGFFLLPLVATLLFGRTFCAGVCPLGAVQDLVALKPVKVPKPVSAVLGVVPFLYLGLAVLFTAAGIGFIVCRFDPFVEIFRFGSRLEILVYAGVVLAIGVFVARPYCRFLCPYGALLSVLSRFSRRHVAVSPTECVDCRLCEDACPFDAILPPATEGRDEPRRKSVRRLAGALLLFPLLMAAGGLGGKLLEGFFVRLSPDVALQAALAREKAAGTVDTTEETKFFRESGRTEAELDAAVARTRQVLAVGSALFGVYVGLVVALKLLGLAIPPSNRSYAPDRAACLSCGRCFRACPQERVRERAKPVSQP
jgi:NosR/NirI family nitrous oxide reductase transcriptional regulator